MVVGWCAAALEASSPSPSQLTDLHAFFGQFITFDIARTNPNKSEPLPIPVPSDDMVRHLYLVALPPKRHSAVHDPMQYARVWLRFLPLEQTCRSAELSTTLVMLRPPQHATHTVVRRVLTPAAHVRLNDYLVLCFADSNGARQQLNDRTAFIDGEGL